MFVAPRRKPKVKFSEVPAFDFSPPRGSPRRSLADGCLDSSILDLSLDTGTPKAVIR